MTLVIPKWLIYTLISSFLCILGVLTVPLISVGVGNLSRGRKSVVQLQTHRDSINARLLNYGLSMSSGSMLITSLYKMLPKIRSGSSDSGSGSNKYTVTFGCLFGIVLSLFLNFVVHAYTSESLIHCAHSHDENENENNNDNDHLDHDHGHNNTDTHAKTKKELLGPDLENQVDQVQTTSVLHKKKSSIRDVLSKKKSCVIGGCQPKSCDLNNEITTKLTPQEGPMSSEQQQEQQQEQEQLEQIAGAASGLTDKESFASAPMCLENSIGYDLQNLDQYRNNFFASANPSSDNTKNGLECAPLLLHHVHHQDHQVEDHQHNHSSDLPNHVQHSYGSTHSDHAHNELPRTSSYNVLEPDLLSTSKSATNIHEKHNDDHHHHMETPFSKLMSIGLQTCVVLTLHKLPEGLILYFTNNGSGKKHSKNHVPGDGDDFDSSSKLGFSIFIALAIHNFIEGFAMCLPLYTALSSKIMAICLISILAGGSQPLGAGLGYMIHKYYSHSEYFRKNGEILQELLLSITSGFLLVISLQMFQTAIGFSDAHSHAMNAVQEDAHTDDHEREHGNGHGHGHGHESGVETDSPSSGSSFGSYDSHSLSHESPRFQDKATSNTNSDMHTSGTTCVKWCCFGAILILSSGLFT
ncbi:hypothetical protein ACO0QE_002137 [Hanseniaspora vineae]